jgi:hypothetical protein
VQNLVLADHCCNNDKRDLLAGPDHVKAWVNRNRHYGDQLIELAIGSHWDSDPMTVVAVARSIYSHLRAGAAPMWRGFKTVTTEDPALVLNALRSA